LPKQIRTHLPLFRHFFFRNDIWTYDIGITEWKKKTMQMKTSTVSGVPTKIYY